MPARADADNPRCRSSYLTVRRVVQRLHGTCYHSVWLPAAFRSFAAAGAPSQAALIKLLRERSGSPITDVKACLEASNWDLDEAYDALRKKGLAAAAKKASRLAAEGLVACASSPSGRDAVVVEINSETDFVSRNNMFQQLAGQVAAAVAALPIQPSDSSTSHELPVHQVLASTLADGRSVSDACADVAVQVRENVRLRRAFRMSVPSGCVSTYVHQSPAPGLGRIACLVALTPEDPQQQLSQEAQSKVDQVGRQLAMHAAGFKPQFLSRGHVTPAVLDKERAILREQAASSGKAAAVVDKMVEGRMSKFYEEVVLLEQRFLLDDTVKVQAVVDRLAQEVQVRLKLAAFLRVQCGEGLEVASKDFAAEVAAAMHV